MAEKRDAALVLAESRQVISAQDLLRTPIEDLTPGAQITAWSVIDLLEKKAIEPRKKALREALLDHAEDSGKSVAKEGDPPKMQIKVEGATITSSTVRGKIQFDIEALESVLSKKGVPTGRVIQEKVVRTINEDAIEGLLAAGILDETDIAEFTSEGASHKRLNVRKSKEVLSLLPKE